MRISPFVLCTLLAATAFGQTDPKPTEPLVKRMPPQSMWSIKFSYGKDRGKEDDEKKPLDPSASGDQQVTRASITKNGTVYREQVTYASGRKAETWSIGGMTVSNAFGSPKQMDGTGSGISNFQHADFDDVTWISIGQYKGIVDYHGKKAFLFASSDGSRKLSSRETGLVDQWKESNSRSKDGQGASEKPAFMDGESRVYLDVATQLPLGFDNGVVAGTYDISSEPSPKIAMPKEFEATIRERLGLLKAYGVDTAKLLKGEAQ